MCVHKTYQFIFEFVYDRTKRTISTNFKPFSEVIERLLRQ